MEIEQARKNAYSCLNELQDIAAQLRAVLRKWNPVMPESIRSLPQEERDFLEKKFIAVSEEIDDCLECGE